MVFWDSLLLTSLFPEARDATLNIEADIINYSAGSPSNLMLKAELYDDENNVVSSFSSRIFALSAGAVERIGLSEVVPSPAQWSAEKSNLYTLIMRLNDSGGIRSKSCSKR